MDLELPDLLKQAYAAEDSPLRGILQGLLDAPHRTAGLDTAGGSALDTVAGRLLWLSAHYLSAAATSHGLQLAYVEGGPVPSALLPRLGAMAPHLPSKLVLNMVRQGDAYAQRLLCGGEQSEFEKSDLRLLEHDPHAAHRLGALVIRCGTGEDPSYLGFLEALLAAQRLIAFVLLVRPADTPAPPLGGFGAGWSIDHIEAVPDPVAVDVIYNTNWNEDILTVQDLKYSAPKGKGGQTGGAPETLLPIVYAQDFGDFNPLETIPSETLGGPQLSVFSLNELGAVMLQEGRLSPVTTQERRVFALDGVNVTGTGIVWRDGRVLFESFMTNGHDASRMRDTGATVTEPTQILEGTYFLAPTGNTHHSHLMWETLRRLNLAEKYGPDVKILTSAVLTPSQREYFPLFGFPLDRVVFKDPNETCRVQRLIVSAEHSQRYDRVSLEYLRRIGAEYYEKPTSRPTRLYLTRRDSRINRNMVNWEEIEPIFEEYGFTNIMASDLSAREKIELFSTAEIVAGPLGAAFTYLPFALNATAIFLTIDEYFPPVYLETAAVQLSRIDYLRGFGMKAYTDVWKYQHSSFYMPPNLVRTVLDMRVAKR